MLYKHAPPRQQYALEVHFYMDNNKKDGDRGTFLRKAIKFINGKGFYIVLFLCVAAIGVAGYVVFSSGVTDLPDPGEIDLSSLFTTKGSTSVTTTDGEIATTNGGDTPVFTTAPVSVIGTTTSNSPNATTTTKLPDNVKLFYVRPVSGSIIRAYSGDVLVFNPTMDDWRVHTGLDIAAAFGDSVVACATGTITNIYADYFKGTVIEITQPDGVVAYYCGMSSSVPIAVGQTVAAGTVIGTIGDTAIFESLDESHLHLEMKVDGEYVDPMEYLPE